jgi:hypothetical protein
MKNIMLLRLIEEEINKALIDLENGTLLEQTPPADPSAAAPADPNAAPPADPAAGGEEESDTSGEEESDDVAEKIKSLAKKTTADIKKTLLSDMQDGEREKAEKVIATVQEDEENKEVTSDLKKAVGEIERVFNFKVSDEIKDEIKKKTQEKKEKQDKEKEEKEKTEKASEVAAPAAPATPAAPAAPVTESKLQTLLREYLLYKQLYEKEANK